MGINNICMIYIYTYIYLISILIWYTYLIWNCHSIAYILLIPHPQVASSPHSYRWASLKTFQFYLWNMIISDAPGPSTFLVFIQWVPFIKKEEILGEVSLSYPLGTNLLTLLCTLQSKTRTWRLSFLMVRFFNSLKPLYRCFFFCWVCHSVLYTRARMGNIYTHNNGKGEVEVLLQVIVIPYYYSDALDWTTLSHSKFRVAIKTKETCGFFCFHPSLFPHNRIQWQTFKSRVVCVEIKVTFGNDTDVKTNDDMSYLQIII